MVKHPETPALGAKPLAPGVPSREHVIGKAPYNTYKYVRSTTLSATEYANRSIGTRLNPINRHMMRQDTKKTIKDAEIWQLAAASVSAKSGDEAMNQAMKNVFSSGHDYAYNTPLEELMFPILDCGQARKCGRSSNALETRILCTTAKQAGIQLHARPMMSP